MKKLKFLVAGFILLRHASATLGTAFLLVALSGSGAANAGEPTSTSICDMPAYRGTAEYNKYCVSSGGSSGSGVPSGGAYTPQQQMILNGAQTMMPLLQQGVHDILYGNPQEEAARKAQAAAEQQRELAAQQLNNSGIYLLKHRNYTGAINEFQQALAQTPGDPNIIKNIALTKQQIKDTATATKNGYALGGLLGNAPASSGTIGFDQLTHSSLPSPNSSALNLVNLNSDASVVDLGRTAKTSVDPATLKNQLNGIFTHSSPVSAPPDPRLQLPTNKDMEMLGQPPQPAPSQWPGPQRPANDHKLVNHVKSEKHIKAETGRQFDAIFAQPGGLDDILEKQTTDPSSK